jgi:hypothetical protein
MVAFRLTDCLDDIVTCCYYWLGMRIVPCARRMDHSSGEAREWGIELSHKTEGIDRAKRHSANPAWCGYIGVPTNARYRQLVNQHIDLGTPTYAVSASGFGTGDCEQLVSGVQCCPRNAHIWLESVILDALREEDRGQRGRLQPPSQVSETRMPVWAVHQGSIACLHFLGRWH